MNVINVEKEWPRVIYNTFNIYRILFAQCRGVPVLWDSFLLRSNCGAKYPAAVLDSNEVIHYLT